MIELPEAATIARQLNEKARNQRIESAVAGQSPHKFAWYTGDPAGYSVLLKGRTLLEARAAGGVVELQMDGGLSLFFNDGTNIRWHKPGARLPEKHQLLLKLDDGSALTVSIQMYGGISCLPASSVENPYLTAGKIKPSPLTESFTPEYFNGLVEQEQARTLSVKAFLATGQRIPGLGNGVLQDILFNAGLNPREKMDTLSADELDSLYRSVKDTLAAMVEKGGRDTENDLLGLPGGYSSVLSKYTVGTACPRCGGIIVKEAYMGGSIYYCPGCQKK